MRNIVILYGIDNIVDIYPYSEIEDPKSVLDTHEYFR